MSSWTLTTDKHAPLQRDILFVNRKGRIYVGVRFMPTQNSNSPLYQEYRKNKIIRNVVKWRLLSDLLNDEDDSYLDKDFSDKDF